MAKFAIKKMGINPLQVMSAALVLLSPFLSWITLVTVVVVNRIAVFGSGVQPTLLSIANAQAGMNLPLGGVTAGLYSTLALLFGGLIALRSRKFGLPLSGLGVGAFVLAFYSIFGSSVQGYEYSFVSPGIGLFVASAGVIIGVISVRIPKGTFSELLGALKTRNGMAGVGVFVGGFSLTLDLLDHWALGQLPAFLGESGVEEVLHLGLLFGVFLSLGLFALRGAYRTDSLLTSTVAFGFSFLVLDGAFHLLTGNPQEFLGHNSSEVSLHLAAYYGLVTMLASRFLQ